MATKSIEMLIGAAALALVASTARGDDLASMQLANELGAVLAGEKACGYSFDSDAVIAYTQAHAPDDIGFPSTLSLMITGQVAMMEQLSDSALIAQCTAIDKTARRFGFIKGEK